ncbi:MAG: hypothetical protein K0A91_07655 [Sulfurimonas sp.]|nr:hypothetical protein [Sulfurimonas sp.]
MYTRASKCEISRVVWTSWDKMVQQKNKPYLAFKKKIAVTWLQKEEV